MAVRAREAMSGGREAMSKGRARSLRWSGKKNGASEVEKNFTREPKRQLFWRRVWCVTFDDEHHHRRATLSSNSKMATPADSEIWK